MGTRRPQLATTHAVAAVIVLGDRREMIDLRRPHRAARQPEGTDPMGGQDPRPLPAVRRPVVLRLVSRRSAFRLRLRRLQERLRTVQPHRRQRTPSANLDTDARRSPTASILCRGHRRPMVVACSTAWQTIANLSTIDPPSVSVRGPVAGAGARRSPAPSLRPHYGAMMAQIAVTLAVIVLPKLLVMSHKICQPFSVGPLC